MRKKIVAGNWKMNLDAVQANQLFVELGKIQSSNVEVIIFPPALYLQGFAKLNNAINIGVQNCHPKECGAFTGELSIPQIKSCGANYSLVGHSERRMYFNESNEFLREKIDACLLHNITPVFCCGEPLEVREESKEFDFVKLQLVESLFHLDADAIQKTILAYEPVWAIGTGLTATSEQAEAMHQEIRFWISERYSASVAESISILYGGSCNASNANELFNCPNVDGGLIGGASLNAESFTQIIDAF